MLSFLNRVTRGLLAACIAAIACAPSYAATVEVAGSLLIDLDAADFKPGSDRWPQHSDGNALTGDFLAKGSPTRQPVGGVPAVVFDGDGDYFVGPITTAALHGPRANHSVEVWAYQGNVREQESLVSWGKRWGPDGTYAGFRYGEDPDFGAIGRWGHYEMGFKDVPKPGRWHHLAYTYDGTRQCVYVDGKLDSSAEAGVLDSHDMMPIHLGVEICGDLKLEGLFTHYSGAMRRVRIHSGVLSHSQVRANYQAERDDFPALVGKPLQQSPLHRFSFNMPAGDAVDGTTVIDRVGGLLAVVRGGGAKFTGRALQLPGGSSASAAYIDLPNGLISSRENLSIEFWETQTAPQHWCRMLSIGTNQSGEITGPGGQFSGSETLTLFGNVGATPCNRFARSEGSYPNGGPDRNPATYPDEDYGKMFHQVITYDKQLKEWHWYRNAILMEVIPDLDGPTGIDDVNVWLGRSEFSQDLNFQGAYNEFRIYNHALGEAEILGNCAAGPDRLNLAATATAMNWTPVNPGIYTFANNGGSDHWGTGRNGRAPNGPGSIATFASELAGDQTIELEDPLTLGTLNLGTRNRGGSYVLRAVNSGSLAMDSGNEVAASITQLPGSPGNLVHSPLILRSDTEVSNQSGQPLLLGGTISGGGAFSKGGNGPVILSGDGRGHTGEVKVVAGALLIGDAGETGLLGGSRFVITDPGLLVFNRSADTKLTMGFSGTGGIVHQGRGKLLLEEGGWLANRNFTDVAHGAGPFISMGVIDGTRVIRVDGALVLAGGSRTRTADYLSIGLTHPGSLEIRDAAELIVEGSGHLNIGDTGAGQSVMRMSDGKVTMNQLFVGKGPDSSGVLLQTGGVMSKVKSPQLVDSRIGGGIEGSSQTWGAWRMTGGEYHDTWNLQVGGFGIGIVEVDGGKLEVDGFLGIGRFEDDMRNAARGLLDVKSGSVNLTGEGRLLLVGEEGIGVLNIRSGGSNKSGGLVDCVNRMIIGAGTINKPGEGTVNLLKGGTLQTTGIGQFNQTEALGRLNLDGGVLKATDSSTQFLEGLDHTYVNSEGVVIDTDRHTVEINQPLLTPRGKGILRIPVVAGGSGYLAPPWIEIKGGAGSGASAVAELENGRVTEVLITNAGNDYLSAPAVSVMGGGAGSGLVLGTPVLKENVSGSLTKTGDGTLVLHGQNTYTGTTTVAKGTLRLTGQLTGALRVRSRAAWTGSGTVLGTVLIENSARVSPTPGSTLTVRGDLVVDGKLVLDIAANGVGRVDVGGKLDLGSGTLSVGPKVPAPGSPVHVIASYGSLKQEFSKVELPEGYVLDYHYKGLNQIALLAPAAANHDDD